MARAETQRLKLLYLYDYFHRCTDEDHPASIAALQAYLKTLQIPAERNTLYGPAAAAGIWAGPGPGPGGAPLQLLPG